MKLPWVWVTTSISLAGLVVLTLLYPGRMISPGPLVPGHAALSGHCAACHAPFRGAVAERCITCHAVAEIGLKTSTGDPLPKASVKTAFHQALTTQDCLACHRDHPTPRQRRAGQPLFRHVLLEAGIRGNCAACHTAPATAMHQNAAANCTPCHTTERWKPANFEHSRFFVLEGDHQVTCATCHPGSDYRTWTCYGCHEHQADKIRTKHLKEGIPNFQNCVRCHRSAEDEGHEDEHGKQGKRR
jgi:Class III cytochrome C family